MNVNTYQGKNEKANLINNYNFNENNQIEIPIF